MSRLPLFLELADVPVLVVGGGVAAERKIRALLGAGAAVTVLSPVLDEAISQRVAAEELQHRAEAFHLRLDPGAFKLVIAAAGSKLNGDVAAWAQTHRLWVNAVDDPAHCTAIWPAIVDRGPLQVAIGSGGAAPVLARRIRARIEALLPERLGELVRLAGRFRDRVGRRRTTFEARRRFWEQAFERWDVDDAEARWEALLARDEHAPGAVHLVGAGPGSPDLLTLRALQVLQTADVIVHDRLVAPEILRKARRDAHFIPVGKAPGGPCVPQERINEILLEQARAGHLVCRLKGGDPLVFGRAGEEIATLEAAGIAVHVVPGITAALGCAASARVSLTHREHAHALVLATAHGQDERALAELAALVGERRTLAVYMGVRELPRLARLLRSRGLPSDFPVLIVENGARPEERRLQATLATAVETARAAKVRPPALIYFGAVFGAAVSPTLALDSAQDWAQDWAQDLAPPAGLRAAG